REDAMHGGILCGGRVVFLHGLPKRKMAEGRGSGLLRQLPVQRDLQWNGLDRVQLQPRVLPVQRIGDDMHEMPKGIRLPGRIREDAMHGGILCGGRVVFLHGLPKRKMAEGRGSELLRQLPVQRDLQWNGLDRVQLQPRVLPVQRIGDNLLEMRHRQNQHGRMRRRGIDMLQVAFSFSACIL
ncbi:MAG: hypothetical protein PHX68_05160, partial [Alphaproteobacteria bacterium]|nr:hypothetical protein [Alphaproteobacteria bacterium]